MPRASCRPPTRSCRLWRAASRRTSTATDRSASPRRVVEANEIDASDRARWLGVSVWGAGGTGPSLKRGGVEYKVGAFGDWAAIGAEQTGGGYQVVWRVAGADQYTVWNTDGQGNYLANATGAVSGSDAFLQALESSFAQDLNGNGQIGPSPRRSWRRTDRGAHLTELGGSRYISLSTGGTGPSLEAERG